MTKQKWIFSLMGCIAILWIAIIAGAEWIEHGLNRDLASAVPTSYDLSDPTGLKIYWDVPTFSFSDQDSRTISNRDLLGHVWVADFIFTQCTSACPILTSKMVLLQRQVKSRDVRFISFSVDPQHDTPAALKSYADLWHGDLLRWRLLSTDPAGLKSLCDGMKVTIAPSGDAENPILHSNLFMLIDTNGRVRGIYDSSDSDAMTRLEDDFHSLSRADAPAVTPVVTPGNDVERGSVLFGSMGCLACHSRRAIAPPVENLYGSMVRLDDRRMIWADEAYLHESIVDPAAKVVAGYTKSMPSYRNYLSDQQVLDLVAYLKTLSSNSPGGHGLVTASATTQPDEPELLTDPVCRMQVAKDSSTPQAVFAGKTYYFCSDHCRDQFLRKPQAYADATTSSH